MFYLSSTDIIPPGVCNQLNPATIYANNEVHLDKVDIYGFDYDYTLALYSNALDAMIYNKARDFLIEHYKVCLWYSYLLSHHSVTSLIPQAVAIVGCYML